MGNNISRAQLYQLAQAELKKSSKYKNSNIPEAELQAKMSELAKLSHWEIQTKLNNYFKANTQEKEGWAIWGLDINHTKNTPTKNNSNNNNFISPDEPNTRAFAIDLLSNNANNALIALKGHHDSIGYISSDAVAQGLNVIGNAIWDTITGRNDFLPLVEQETNIGHELNTLEQLKNQTTTRAQFNKGFKELYGIDFNPTAFKKLQNANKELSQLNSLEAVENYFEFGLKEIKKETPANSGFKINALLNPVFNNPIKTQEFIDELKKECKTDEEFKARVIHTLTKAKSEATKSKNELLKTTTRENLENNYKKAYKEAMGDYHAQDIIEQYLQSQQTQAMYTETALIMATSMLSMGSSAVKELATKTASSLGTKVGGQVFKAGMTVTTASLPAAETVISGLTSKNGDVDWNLAREQLKNGLIYGGFGAYVSAPLGDKLVSLLNANPKATSAIVQKLFSGVGFGTEVSLDALFEFGISDGKMGQLFKENAQGELLGRFMHMILGGQAHHTSKALIDNLAIKQELDADGKTIYSITQQGKILYKTDSPETLIAGISAIVGEAQGIKLQDLEKTVTDDTKTNTQATEPETTKEKIIIKKPEQKVEHKTVNSDPFDLSDIDFDYTPNKQEFLDINKQHGFDEKLLDNYSAEELVDLDGLATDILRSPQLVDNHLNSKKKTLGEDVANRFTETLRSSKQHNKYLVTYSEGRAKEFKQTAYGKSWEFNANDIKEKAQSAQTYAELDALQTRIFEEKQVAPQQYKKYYDGLLNTITNQRNKLSADIYTHMNKRIEGDELPIAADFKQIITKQILEAKTIEDVKLLENDLTAYKKASNEDTDYSDITSLLQNKFTDLKIENANYTEILKYENDPILKKHTDKIETKKAEITEKLNTAYEDFNSGKANPAPDTFYEILKMKLEDCKNLSDIEHLKNKNKEYTDRTKTVVGGSHLLIADKEIAIRNEILDNFSNRINNSKTLDELHAIKQEYHDFKNSDEAYEKDNLVANNTQKSSNSDYQDRMISAYQKVNELIDTKSKELSPQTKDNNLSTPTSKEAFNMEDFELELAEILKESPKTEVATQQKSNNSPPKTNKQTNKQTNVNSTQENNFDKLLTEITEINNIEEISTYRKTLNSRAKNLSKTDTKKLFAQLTQKEACLKLKELVNNDQLYNKLIDSCSENGNFDTHKLSRIFNFETAKKEISKLKTIQEIKEFQIKWDRSELDIVQKDILFNQLLKDKLEILDLENKVHDAVTRNQIIKTVTTDEGLINTRLLHIELTRYEIKKHIPDDTISKNMVENCTDEFGIVDKKRLYDYINEYKLDSILTKVKTKSECNYLEEQVRLIEGMSSNIRLKLLQKIKNKKENFFNDEFNFGNIDDLGFERIRARMHPVNFSNVKELHENIFADFLDYPKMNIVYEQLEKTIISYQNNGLASNIHSMDNNGLRGRNIVTLPEVFFDKAKASGLKCIIDLRDEASDNIRIKKDKIINENGVTKIDGVEYFRIPVDHTNGSCDDATIKNLGKFFKKMEAGNFYIGCANGSHRTDFAIALNYALNTNTTSCPNLKYKDATEIRPAIFRIYNKIQKLLSNLSPEELTAYGLTTEVIKKLPNQSELNNRLQRL